MAVDAYAKSTVAVVRWAHDAGMIFVTVHTSSPRAINSQPPGRISKIAVHTVTDRSHDSL